MLTDAELRGGGRCAGFLPHSSFIVPPVRGEERLRGSWPSFLKCQAPWGGRATSGPAPPLQLESRANNDATCADLQPSVAFGPAVESSGKNSASQLVGREQSVSRGQVSRGKQDPYSSQVRGVPMTLPATENVPPSPPRGPRQAASLYWARASFKDDATVLLFFSVS